MDLDFEDSEFRNIVIANEKSFIHLKTNVTNEEELIKWKDIYCAKNNLCFNVKRLYNVSRWAYHKKFVCLQGDTRNTGVRRTCTGCPVTMDVKIKIQSKSLLKKDPDMRTHPCVIMIKGDHNHQTQSSSILRELRVLTKTKEQFFKYFELGMTVAQARKFHLDKINLNEFEVANASINPTDRAIYHLHNVWLKTKHGSQGKENMFSAVKKYAAENHNTKIEFEVDGDEFAAVLVTNFMQRVHQELKEASEVVFVDTVSHFDQPSTAVTLLLCAGPAGAAPLGVIFTSSQEESSYTKGFCLLKKVMGEDAFYGCGQPNYFITDNNKAERKALKATWPDSQLFLCISYVLQQIWRWLCDGCHAVKKEDRSKLMNIAKQLVYADSEVQFQDYWARFCHSHEAQQYDEYTRYLSNLVERKQEWSVVSQQGYVLLEHQTNDFMSTMCIIKDIIISRCKAYNTCQLIMFIDEIYDNYMKERLLDVALARCRTRPLLKSSISLDNITQVSGCKFTMKSESKDVDYNVDLEVGMCDCTCGQTGAVCKHQVACSEVYLQQLPEVFNATPEQRQQLEAVARGKEKIHPFADLQKVKEVPYKSPTYCDRSTLTEDLVEASKGTKSISSYNVKECDAVEISNTTSRDMSEGVKNLPNTTFWVISHYGEGLTPQGMANVVKQLISITSTTKLNSLLCLPGSSAMTMQDNGLGKIPCRPTSDDDKRIKVAKKIGIPRLKPKTKKALRAILPKPTSFSPEFKVAQENAATGETIFPAMKEGISVLDSSMVVEIEQKYGDGDLLEIKEEPIDIKTELPDDAHWSETLPAEVPTTKKSRMDFEGDCNLGKSLDGLGDRKSSNTYSAEDWIKYEYDECQNSDFL